MVLKTRAAECDAVMLGDEHSELVTVTSYEGAKKIIATANSIDRQLQDIMKMAAI